MYKWLTIKQRKDKRQYFSTFNSLLEVNKKESYPSVCGITLGIKTTSMVLTPL